MSLRERSWIDEDGEEKRLDRKTGWIAFREFAFKSGYKYKTYGDDSFSKRHLDPQSKTIRLLGMRNNKIQVYEEGVGRYELEIVDGKARKK